MTASLLDMLLAAAVVGLASAGLAAFIWALPWPASFYRQKPGGCWICMAGWGVTLLSQGAAPLVLPLGWWGLGASALAFVLLTTRAPAWSWVPMLAASFAYSVLAVAAGHDAWAPTEDPGATTADAAILFYAAWATAALVLRAMLPAPLPAATEILGDLDRLSG